MYASASMAFLAYVSRKQRCSAGIADVGARPCPSVCRLLRVHARVVRTAIEFREVVHFSNPRSKMAILLVRPFYNTHIITPPLGLGYLSSYLQERGIETKIIDAVRDNLTEDVLLDRILQEQPEAVGIMCMTCYYGTVGPLCRKLKSYG